MCRLFLWLLGWLAVPVGMAANPVLRVDYEGFTVWLDCKEHAVYRFRYTAQRDTGDYPRASTFRLDPAVPYECQPASANSFKTEVPGSLVYERAHQVPSNHLDYSELAIRQSNYMTNILPQTQALNRGAWYRTERLIECYRDTSELLVLGGAVWGNSKAARKNDVFMGSHGIRTPDYFWKVVIRGDGATLAWWIPNDGKANAASLDRYLVKPAQVESKSRLKLPEVPKPWRLKKPKASWPLPVGCDAR